MDDYQDYDESIYGASGGLPGVDAIQSDPLVKSASDYQPSPPPSEKIQDERLFSAIRSSYKMLEWARDLKRRLVYEYLGPDYGNRGGNKKIFNKINQFVDTYTMLLASNSPRANITTDYIELAPFSHHYEIGLNNLIKEIGLEKTARSWVMDAIFLMGIVRLHMADAGYIVFEGDVGMDPGTPFLSNVPFDDWVHDMSAHTEGQWAYAGYKYRIPFRHFEMGISEGLYDQQYGSTLTPTTKYHSGQGRIDDISRGYITDHDEIEPMIDLADIWIPEQQQIRTYSVKDRASFILDGSRLATIDWIGPETGPFVTLGFGDAPESVIPVSPLSQMYALDEIINVQGRKTARQAARSKENLIAEAGSEEAGKSLSRVKDGVVVNVPSVEGVKRFIQGGVDPGGAQYLNALLEYFDILAGNLKALQGLAPQSDTVGQEQLIHNASGKRIATMQLRVLEGMRKVIYGLASLLWNDNYKFLPGSIEPAAGEPRVPANWRPGDRQGEFDEFNYDVNVYSMANRTPQERANTIISLLQNVFIPMGLQVNPDALVTILSDLTDEPAFKELIPGQGMYERVMPTPGEAKKSPVSQRNYTRTSQSATQSPSFADIGAGAAAMNGAPANEVI